MDFSSLCRLGGLRVSAECVDPDAELIRRRLVIVEDKMQQGYQYQLSASAGCDFAAEFKPDLTPKEM